MYLWHSSGVGSWFADLGGERTFAYAINNNGKVAGYAEDANETKHPVTWTDGVLTELPLLRGSSPGWGGGGKALGLDDRRGVVGFSPAADGQHAVLWVNGKANDLNRILGSVSSVANAINNKGQIIGSAYFADGRYEAFLYQGGTVQFLGTMDGNAVSAIAINDNGQIAGRSGNQYREKNRAFLWENSVSRISERFGETPA